MLVTKYMGIPAGPRPQPEISYEEQRIQDYIHSYQTTGHPPLPVPDTPTDPTARIALGLPALFEPLIEPLSTPTAADTGMSLPRLASNSSQNANTVNGLFGLGGLSGGASGASGGGGVNGTGTQATGLTARSPRTLAELPSVQVFSSTTEPGPPGLSSTELMNIVCHTEYRFFSPEELRLHAYRTGKQFAPEAVGNEPAVPSIPPDQFQSISCEPQYMQHSFEELRLAYVRLGHEASSSEITQQNGFLRLTA